MFLSLNHTILKECALKFSVIKKMEPLPCFLPFLLLSHRLLSYTCVDITLKYKVLMKIEFINFHIYLSQPVIVPINIQAFKNNFANILCDSNEAFFSQEKISFHAY